MPTANLGNVRPAISEGAGLYSHEFDSDNLIHNLSGEGRFGYCKCIENYDNTNHTFLINGGEVPAINLPNYIQQGNWIVFTIDDDNSLYLLNKASQSVIPDGEIVTPVDDPEIWCACAGINWYEIGSPDAYTLASSEEYCAQLFNSENAFAYYRRSSQIIKDTMTTTNVISCIENLDYFTSSALTSATAPEGYVASTNVVGHQAGSAVFGPFSANYVQGPASNATGNYYKIQLPEPIWPYKMTIIPDGAGKTTYLAGPPIFEWQASSDGNDWIVLSSFSDVVTAINTPRIFYNTEGITGKYQYYRIFCRYASSAVAWSVGQGKIHGIL